MLVKGGTVIDPAQDLHAVRDVAIAAGRIAALESEIYEETAKTVIDAAGYLVTPWSDRSARPRLVGGIALTAWNRTPPAWRGA